MIKSLLQEFWKPLAALGAFFAAIIFKKGYDHIQQKKGEERVKDDLDRQSLKRDQEFAGKGAKIAYETMVNAKDIPATWDNLRKLSQKTTDSSEASKKKRLH